MYPTKQDESLAQAPMNPAEIPPMQAETPPTMLDETHITMTVTVTEAEMPTMTKLTPKLKH